MVTGHLVPLDDPAARQEATARPVPPQATGPSRAIGRHTRPATTGPSRAIGLHAPPGATVLSPATGPHVQLVATGRQQASPRGAGRAVIVLRTETGRSAAAVPRVVTGLRRVVPVRRAVTARGVRDRARTATVPSARATLAARRVGT